MVDVFLFTADNTDMTELVRLYWHPQSESLARLMISMLSEQLRSCHFLKERYENQNKEMRQEFKWVTGSPTQP